MAHYRLNTKRNQCLVEVHVTNKAESPLGIVGFDADNDHTEYFNRNTNEAGKQVFQFGCPQTPSDLSVVVFDKKLGYVDFPETFTVDAIKVKQLEYRPLYGDKLTSDFVKFAQSFSEKAGHCRPATYSDPKRQFEIRYLDKIRDVRTGERVHTPARIHQKKHYIEFSQEWFKDMTIPMRLMILLHEYSHIYLNNDPADESEADLNGVNIFLSLGYPFIECAYAYTKVFGDSSETNQRLQNIANMMYKRKETR